MKPKKSPFQAAEVNQRKITTFFRKVDPNAPPVTRLSGKNKVQTTLTKHLRRRAGQNSNGAGPSSAPVADQDIIVISSDSETEVGEINNGNSATKDKKKEPPAKKRQGKSKPVGQGAKRRKNKTKNPLSDSDTDIESIYSTETEDEDPSSDFELELRSTRSSASSSAVKSKPKYTSKAKNKSKSGTPKNGISKSTQPQANENAETQVIEVVAATAITPLQSSSRQSIQSLQNISEVKEQVQSSASGNKLCLSSVVRPEKDPIHDTAIVAPGIPPAADDSDSDASVSLLAYEKTPPKVYTIEDSTDLEETTPKASEPISKIDESPKPSTNIFISGSKGPEGSHNDEAATMTTNLKQPRTFQDALKAAEEEPIIFVTPSTLLQKNIGLTSRDPIVNSSTSAPKSPVHSEDTQIVPAAVDAVVPNEELETQAILPYIPRALSFSEDNAETQIISTVSTAVHFSTITGSSGTNKNCAETQVIHLNINEVDTPSVSPRIFEAEDDEFLTQVNADIRVASTVSPSNQITSANSPTAGDNQLMLSPGKSPALVRKTPTKSPKTKASYYSPVRHVRNLSRGSPSQTSPSKNGIRISTPSNSRKASPATPTLHSSQQSSSSSLMSPTAASSSARKSNWTPGGDPYYLEHFRMIVDSVSGDSHHGHLLNEADAKIIADFNNLSRPSQSLYVRLFQRKWNWKCAASIKYPQIAENLVPGFEELHRNNFLIEIQDATPDLTSLLDLLNMEQMSLLGKKMSLNPKSKTKDGYKAALLKMVKSQRTLSGSSVDIITKAAISELGPTYQISESSRYLFSRIFILYAPPQYWDDESNQGSNQILTILLTNTGKVEYPVYGISKSIKIYKSRADLIRFHEAWTHHSDIQGQLESKAYNEAKKILQKALDTLKFEIFSHPENSIQNHDRELPEFLRAYTAGSVLARTVWIGIDAYQKNKEYSAANEIILFLLSQNIYLTQYRGRWHDRYFINSKHLKLTSLQLRKLIKTALDDKSLGEAHRLGFTLRLQKFTNDEATKKGKQKHKPKAAKKPKGTRRTRSKAKISSDSDEDEADESEEPDPTQYSTFSLKYEVPERTIEGEKMSVDSERAYGKSVFLGGGSSSSSAGNSLSSVELFAMDFYRKQGYTQGLHAESIVPIAIFGLLFWDVIYDDSIPDVFHSPFQSFPLDLHFEDFYSKRFSSIESMLLNLRAKWSLNNSFEIIERNWEKHHGKLSVVNWSIFESVDTVKDLVKSMGLQMLAGICERLAKNFRYYRSGFPDLVVWNGHDCLFAEVKGPNDTLSTKQSVWLDYLISIGATAEVCHVKSVSNKRIRLT